MGLTRVNLIGKKQKSKFKLGVAFSGGGAKGVAHIGVIKALDEAGINIDYVAGTSAGSIIGALYAFGLTADEMIEIVKNIDAKNIVKSYIRLPNSTEGIENIIKESIGDVHFDELCIPFTAVATDIVTGNEVHLNVGSVATACAASCSVPVIFKYVEIGDCRLQDGGLLNNIPSDVVRNMGAEKVLAIDINSTRGAGTESTKLVSIAAACLGIAMKQNSLRGLQNADLSVSISLKDFSSFKLDGYEEMIEKAYQETKKKIPEIKEMLGIKEKRLSLAEWLKAKKDKKAKEKNAPKKKKDELKAPEAKAPSAPQAEDEEESAQIIL